MLIKKIKIYKTEHLKNRAYEKTEHLKNRAYEKTEYLKQSI
jgi:hypothetical protein